LSLYRHILVWRARVVPSSRRGLQIGAPPCAVHVHGVLHGRAERARVSSAVRFGGRLAARPRAPPAGTPASALTVGVPKETAPLERRCAATPESVAKLVKAGFTVLCERTLGAGSELSDDAYAAAGARLVSRAEAFNADIVTKIRPFTADEIGQLKRGATCVSLLAPAQNGALMSALAAAGVTALGLDCVPRTLSRAQVRGAPCSSPWRHSCPDNPEAPLTAPLLTAADAPRATPRRRPSTCCPARPTSRASAP
jgi:hypothetical protein